MKTSIEWLKEYSDIDVSVEELADILTMTGSKVETIESKGDNIKNVVVGKILEIEKHPDADKLIVTKINVGSEIIQVVTAAKNVNAFDIIPVAKDGAELANGLKIKKGNLRGVESSGMMCSLEELGLDIEQYPEQIEDGIMILDKSFEEKIGEDIIDVLGLREDIIDLEITPNRPDCLSVEGLGREVAASLSKTYKKKDVGAGLVPAQQEIEGLRVDITAPDLCYRYIARVVKNVKIQESPEWMRRRLNASGVRSINNIVDITNYVMLEMGQPMHAFDINSIEGKHITVRRAKEQETITTLDEQERKLDTDMLVISDEKKAVAIAGVMGGLNSEIEEGTKTVVFESAVFNGGSVRKTAKKVGLRTEASSRYEKGLSADNAERAVNRAVELVELIGAGVTVNGKVDVYPTKQEVRKIKLEVEKINNLLGTEISKEEMVKILESIEIKLENDVATIPYFRMDLEVWQDLAEEVLRFYGYDKLKTTLIESGASTLGIRTKIQRIEDNLKQMLVARGLSEISTYGFVNPKDLDKVNIPSDSILRKETINVKNPLSEDYTIMRATTISSMMQTLYTNYSHKNKNVSLYDISRTYRDKNQAVSSGNVPAEEKILTIGIYGEDADFYKLKGLIEDVLILSGLSRYEIAREENNSSYHPGKTAKVTIGKDEIAVFGEIHPIVLRNYEIQEKVVIAEINITKLTKYSKNDKKYSQIPRFPAVERDIAIIVDEEVEVGTIEKIIQKQAKKVLESLELFDVYRDKKLGDNKKSVAYELIFREANKTLTDEEINPIMDSIISALEKEVGAELRK